ncbi:hypothethical protein (plasmid) [Ralstonia solanacearum PSI07]|nr:hypothethical protein [Ralstonia solanacearum PSI07]
MTGILFVLQSSIPWETLPCQTIHHHATPSRHHSACRWGL